LAWVSLILCISLPSQESLSQEQTSPQTSLLEECYVARSYLKKKNKHQKTQQQKIHPTVPKKIHHTFFYASHISKGRARKCCLISITLLHQEVRVNSLTYPASPMLKNVHFRRNSLRSLYSTSLIF